MYNSYRFIDFGYIRLGIDILNAIRFVVGCITYLLNHRTIVRKYLHLMVGVLLIPYFIYILGRLVHLYYTDPTFGKDKPD